MSASTDDSAVFPPGRDGLLATLRTAALRAQAGLATSPVLRRLMVLACGLALPALVFVLWQQASEQHWVPEQLLPAPSLVWNSLRELWASGDLQSNLAYSGPRVGWSLLIGGAAGLALGVGMALWPGVKAYLLPSFEVVAQFPVLGWVPLLIIFAGIDEALKISAISIAVAVPVTINTLRGIADVPQSFLEVARVHGLGRMQSLRFVVLPAATPALFTGFRQAVMQAWLTLVFVELLASSEGIGYLIVWGRQLAQPDLVVAGMVVIGLVGVLLDLGLRSLEARLLGWRQSAFH